MRIFLAFIATLLATCAIAQEASTELLAELQQKEIQRRLVCTGFLNAEIGRATDAELQTAVERFRQANNLPGGRSGPLTDADKRLLTSIESTIGELIMLERFSHKTSAGYTLTLDVPKGLVSTPPQFAGDGWIEFGPGTRVMIDLFRRNLSRDTVSSLFVGHLRTFRLTSFNTLTKTADEFIAEGVTNDRGARYFFHHRAFEFKGAVHGVFLKFRLSSPPASFGVPSVLGPTIAHKDLRAELLRQFDGRQIADADEPPATDADLAWLLVARIATKLMTSDFNALNGWRTVDTSPCERGGAAADSQKIRIVFATNRHLMPEYRPVDGANIDTTQLFDSRTAHELHIGCAELTVPNRRIAKKLYTPFEDGYFSSRKAIPPDPAKHLIARRVLPLVSVPAGDEDYVRLTSRKPGHSGKALLFVHGYNNSFSDALLRTAQIAANSGYTEGVYLFSWPSLAWFADYTPDMNSAEASEQALQSFLKAIIHDHNVTSLDVIAHSMGSHQLIRALGNLRSVFDRRTETAAGRLRLRQVIFAAPDVASPIFAAKVAQLAPFAKRVTVYVSTADVALATSRRFHGGGQRAGARLESEDPVLIKNYNVDVIDISPQPITWLQPLAKLGEYTNFHHADFTQYDEAITDIQTLLRFSTPLDTPCDRNVKFKRRAYAEDSARSYWMLPHDAKETTDPSLIPCKAAAAANAGPAP
jgi:esterase/lipase superfamily enzyme